MAGESLRFSLRLPVECHCGGLQRLKSRLPFPAGFRVARTMISDVPIESTTYMAVNFGIEFLGLRQISLRHSLQARGVGGNFQNFLRERLMITRGYKSIWAEHFGYSPHIGTDAT